MKVSTRRDQKPQQGRSVETVSRILDAGWSLLAEVGIEGFSTNAVAKQAGVNIGTVYRYFDDKFAIVRELMVGESNRRMQALASLLRELQETDDLHLWAMKVLEEIRALFQAEPRSIPLEVTVRSLPQFRDFIEEADANFATAISSVLAYRRPELGEVRCRTRAGVMQFILRYYAQRLHSEDISAEALDEIANLMVNCLL